MRFYEKPLRSKFTTIHKWCERTPEPTGVCSLFCKPEKNSSTMNAPLLILFAASLAFVLIEILRWQDYEDIFYNCQPFNRKPLNCIPCLSGWIGLVTAFV